MLYMFRDRIFNKVKNNQLFKKNIDFANNRKL